MKTIYTKNAILIQNKKETYLSADIAAASGTLTVDSITGFAIDKVILIGEVGSENAEIIKTHGSTAPSGSTITLLSNTVYAHTQGTKVYLIDYDQLEVSHADTATGTKTVLSTFAIQADQLETQYTDTAETAGYYFTRWKNTIDTAYSSYSDAIPYAGFATNQVGKVIEYALKRNKLDTFTDNVDHDFCIDEINSCLKYIRGKRKKWHRLQSFDYALGQTEQGEWAFTPPATMWGYSNKSILDIHLEGETSLDYKDEREWNDMLDNTIYDTLASAGTVADKTLTLDDSYSFQDSGTVMCRGDEIDFTANATTTGILTCSALENALADGSMVWKGDYEVGMPEYYTIKDGKVYIYPIPSSSYDNINIMIDYWLEAPEIDSDGDTLDVSRFDMVKHWLVWAIRGQVKNDGLRDPSDSDYLMFEQMLRDALKIEAQTGAQKYKTKPKINKIHF